MSAGGGAKRVGGSSELIPSDILRYLATLQCS